MRGLCEFYSETGTEGGYWAFHDERFITPDTTTLTCTKCFMWWDSAKHPDAPQDQIEEDRSPEALVSLREAFGKSGFTPEQIQMLLAPQTRCANQEHQWKLAFPNGAWSYEGLHILKNGDRLTIFDKQNPQQQVWSGVIRLRRHKLFTQAAFNLWIHADQRGIERETWARWFFENYPAELTPKRDIKQ